MFEQLPVSVPPYNISPKNKCIYNNTAGIFKRLSYNHGSGYLQPYLVAYSQPSFMSKLEFFYENI